MKADHIRTEQFYGFGIFVTSPLSVSSSHYVVFKDIEYFAREESKKYLVADLYIILGIDLIT
jgi:hypothetical protein